MPQVPSGGPGAAGAAAAKPRMSGLAVASLICGIGSLCTAGLSGVAGLVLGLVALSRISRSGGKTGGRVLAITGTVISLFGIFFLIVVIAASALVVSTAIHRSAAAKRQEARAEVTRLSNALGQYQTFMHHYPTEEEGGLKALIVLQRDPDGPGLSTWGPVLYELPPDPWGHPYVYRCPGAHNPKRFDVHSLGPDGVEGTGDDITNWDGSLEPEPEPESFLEELISGITD